MRRSRIAICRRLGRLEARLRRSLYRILRLLGTRYQRAYPDYYEFFPAVKDAAYFSDLSARVNCYLGDTGKPLHLSPPHHAVNAGDVPYFEPALVKDPGWVPERPEGQGHLVVHRITAKALWRVATSRVPATVVDPRLHAYSEMQYFQLRNSTTWPTYAPTEVMLSRLRAPRPSAKSAFILATGPSALDVELESVEADFRITCNSAVRDIERIEAFRPNVIAFTDPVFHFGPSRYAAAFRRDVQRAVEAVDAFVICGHDFAGPLLGLVPGLKERLIVVPHQAGGPFRWPTERDPTIRQVGNVLTDLMLPIAMMMAEKILVAGADGREPGEAYFWRHNPRLQYSDELMESVFRAHPAFFRDTDYGDYYEQLCRDIGELVAAGEAAGKIVAAVTPSWIPAFAQRQLNAPAQH